MGHDTTAYRLTELEYLRRGAFDHDKKLIYQLLQADNFFNSVSGNGSKKVFYQDEILAALKNAKSTNAPEDIITFLEGCASEDWVLIEFG